MTDKVKEAIAVLRELPKREQETLANAIIDYASQDVDVQLSDVQVEEVRRRRAAKNRKYISLPQLDKQLRRRGI